VALTDDQKAMLRLLAQREQGYPDIAALTGQSVEEVRRKVSAAVEALGGAEAPAEDQRAMLRLLAQREEGYADIAALTGQSVDEVRSKVAVALEELGGGQPASRPVSPAPAETSKPAPAPKESTPAAPKPASPKPAAKPPRPRPGRPSLPADRSAVWGLGAGLAVVLVLVILLATGVLGGGGSDSNSEPSEATSGNSEGQASGKPQPTKAVLEAVGGGNAKGLALFGRENKQVLLLIQATGLEPSPQNKSYVVSLAKSGGERLPVVVTSVPANGRLEGSFKVEPPVLGLLASGWDTMEVSLVSNGELNSAVKNATNTKQAPEFGGEDALRGTVTGAIVEAGEKGEVRP
jgi:hypothetical protein